MNNYLQFSCECIWQHYNEQMADPVQKQYSNLVSSIGKVAYLLSKHDSIRLKHWLEKLAVPVTNGVWRQNRNLYLKILLEMIAEGELLKPFNHSPPEGPLPKITLYDVPYPIRLKLIEQESRNTPSQHKTSYHSRKNSLSNNVDPKRSLSKDNRKSVECKKKISFDTTYSDMENKQNRNSINLHENKSRSKEENHGVSKDLFNSKNSTCKFKSNDLVELVPEDEITQKGCEILKKSLKFLGKYYENFAHSITYKQLVQKIIETGDELGQNFRQVSIPSLQQSIQIQKYNERIKDKLFQTDLNSLQFMSYLNSLV